MKPITIKDVLSFDKDLIKSDQSLDINIPIHEPTDLSNISDQSFLFIKERKFLNKIFDKKDLILDIFLGAIINKNLFDKLEGEEQKVIQEIFNWTLFSNQIDLSLSLISKEFYNQKYLNILNTPDGRDLKTAQVSSSANISKTSYIGTHVKIGANVVIHSGAVVMAYSEIEDGVEVFPNVTIYPFVKIKKNCRIHSSSVIGADGFGYNFYKGEHLKVWHMGSAIIEENVEIGANSCVDGGTFSPTIIGAGSKLDNHVQIGHNCLLGKGVIICGHVAIGGSSKIGDYSVFGGKSGMGHGLSLGSACQVGGGALVNTDWPDGSVLGGHPARNLKEWMRGLAFVRKESLKSKKRG